MSNFNTNLEVLLNQILQTLKGPDQTEVLTTDAVSTTAVSLPFLIKSGYGSGSVVAVTTSAFNGTTSTLSLKGSIDGITYVQVYMDDDVTALTSTLATNSTYTFLLKKVLFKYYKLVYVVGDATLGTFSATTFSKHTI